MSSDGLRHEGEMNALDKDSVYQELRKRGIRAIRVTERITPIVQKGFSGLRRRDWGFIVGIVVSTVILSVIAYREIGDVLFRRSDVPLGGVLAQPQPRRWIKLPASVEYSELFKYRHEVYLACYAMPGVVMGKTEVSDELMQDFVANLGSSIVVYDGDTPEIAELKGIVAGMKEDAQRYLSMSNGMRRLAIWLEERQLMEQGYRESFLVRVKKGEMKAEDVNDMFRAMGMRMIGE